MVSYYLLSVFLSTKFTCHVQFESFAAFHEASDLSKEAICGVETTRAKVEDNGRDKLCILAANWLKEREKKLTEMIKPTRVST
jgi:hypothetical protein